MSNIKKIVYFSIVLIYIFFGVLAVKSDSSVQLRTSVTIYNPNGASAQIVAVPEKRIANVSESQVYNRSTLGRFQIFSQGADRAVATPLYNQQLNTDDEGKYYLPLYGFSETSTYDAIFKGYSHLTRLYGNFVLGNFHTIDFSSSSVNPLLSGDINLTEGDDKVNALDISVLVNAWGTSDSRADLNQDSEVNAIDISNLLSNFNSLGD